MWPRAVGAGARGDPAWAGAALPARGADAPGPEHPMALKDVSLSVPAARSSASSGCRQRPAGARGGDRRDPRSLGGRIEVAGQTVTRAGARTMQRLGVAHVPEDRLGAGLVGTLPLTDSMILTRVAKRRSAGLGILNHDAASASLPPRSRSSAFAFLDPRRAPAPCPGPCRRRCSPASWRSGPWCWWRRSPPRASTLRPRSSERQLLELGCAAAP